MALSLCQWMIFLGLFFQCSQSYMPVTGKVSTTKEKEMHDPQIINLRQQVKRGHLEGVMVVKILTRGGATKIKAPHMACLCPTYVSTILLTTKARDPIFCVINITFIGIMKEYQRIILLRT